MVDISINPGHKAIFDSSKNTSQRQEHNKLLRISRPITGIEEAYHRGISSLLQGIILSNHRVV